MFAWRRREAEHCGGGTGAGDPVKRVLPLSVGPSLAVAKGFEGSCPHIASGTEVVGAEERFLWLDAAGEQVKGWIFLVSFPWVPGQPPC